MQGDGLVAADIAREPPARLDPRRRDAAPTICRLDEPPDDPGGPPGRLVPIEARFSEIAVYDAGGRRIETSLPRGLGRPPRTVVVDLPDIADGPYRVSWKTLSAIDGQTTAGSYRFAVGVEQRPEPPTLSDMTPDIASPDAVSAVVRWLTYLSTAVLVGAVPYVCWVAAPILQIAPAVGVASRRLAALAATVAVVVGILGLLAQAMHASGATSFEAMSTSLVALLTTRYGQLWLDRMVMTVILALLVAWGRIHKPRHHPHRFLALLAAVGILVALSLNSRAAAMQTDQALAIALDLVHLVGMAVWVGGLAHLLAATLVLARARRPRDVQVLGHLVDRYSPFATWSVVALVGSGLYQSVTQIGSVEVLAGTPYGQALAWKLGLLAPMLAIGLFHAVFFRPRLRTNGDPAHDRRAATLAVPFRWSVGAEVVLGVLVLAATGLLRSREPAREALARMSHMVEVTQPADHARLHVHVHPEGQVHGWINDVTSSSVMPAFDRQISEDERGLVLNVLVPAVESNGRATRR